MKITKRQLRRNIREASASRVAYHSTDPANISSIQQDGLQVGRESAHTTAGEWADEYYGTRPIYISMQKGKYEGQPLKIDTSNLSLVADLPGLVDTGAMIEEEGMYWDEGEEPQAVLNFVDEDGMIYFEDLLDPSHPLAQIAIDLTGTAAVLENIPPDRIQLIEGNKMRITKRQLRRIIKEEINNSLTENPALRGEAAYDQGTKDALATSIGEMDGPADPRNRDYMAGFEDESDEIESRQGGGPYSVRESRNRKKVTKSRLRRIVKEAMHAPGGSDSSEDIMKKLNQLGWTEELRDAVGDVKGAGGYLGPTDADEEEYDLLMSNPEVAALVKAYAVARQAEHENY